MVPAASLHHQCEARSSAPTPSVLVPGSDCFSIAAQVLVFALLPASRPCLPCLDPKSASVSHHSLSLPHLLLLSLYPCSWSPAQVLMWRWEGTWPFTVWPFNASTRTLLHPLSVICMVVERAQGRGKGSQTPHSLCFLLCPR